MQTAQGCFGIPRRQNPAQSQITFFSTTPTNISGQIIQYGTVPYSQTGPGFYYVSNATVGTRIYVKQTGIYAFRATGSDSGGALLYAIAANATSYTGSGSPTAPTIAMGDVAGAGNYINLMGVALLQAGDYVSVFYGASNTPVNGTFQGILIQAI